MFWWHILFLDYILISSWLVVVIFDDFIKDKLSVIIISPSVILSYELLDNRNYYYFKVEGEEVLSIDLWLYVYNIFLMIIWLVIDYCCCFCLCINICCCILSLLMVNLNSWLLQLIVNSSPCGQNKWGEDSPIFIISSSSVIREERGGGVGKIF